MKALVFQHEDEEGPGLFGPALRAAGFTLETRLRQVLPGDEDAPLVLVMGGPMAVYESGQHPYLETERRLLATRLERGLPSIGICLGAQLLAAAAGARVYAGAHGFELGVHDVTLTPAGRADPLFAHAPPSFPAAHWHQDTFDAVPGAELLASSAAYSQQAFRVGRSYGLQFHLELEPDTFRRWLSLAPEDVARSGHSAAALSRQAELLETHRSDLEAIVRRLCTLAS